MNMRRIAWRIAAAPATGLKYAVSTLDAGVDAMQSAVSWLTRRPDVSDRPVPNTIHSITEYAAFAASIVGGLYVVSQEMMPFPSSGTQFAELISGGLLAIRPILGTTAVNLAWRAGLNFGNRPPPSQVQNALR